jgi:hypothetical protein
MYLLTFALLVISVLGIYTQVYALETARLFASETTIGQTFVNWHEAAASVAEGVIEPLTVGGIGGCRLLATKAYWANAPTQCTTGTHLTLNASTPTDIATGSYAFGGNTYPLGAPGYSYSPYQWNSIAFEWSGSYLVATFVSAAPGADISTATGTTLNLTEGDLYRQLQNMGIPVYDYGYVTNPAGGPATLNAGPSGTNPSTQYTVPTSIPNGALAIISFPGQCNGC